MFGREYSQYPDLLMHSFAEMTDEKQEKKIPGRIFLLLQKIYLKLFGIPEIGFQIRSLYFSWAIKKKVSSSPKRILNAGCGIGTHSFYLNHLYPDVKVEGWDIDKDKIAFCQHFSGKSNLNNLRFSVADLTKINDKRGKYDLIVNIDVLEHIKNYKKVLKSFYNLLNKEGYLVLHTPQPNQKRIIKKLNEWSHESHIYEGFEADDLKDYLYKLGFKEVYTRETFGFFGKIAWEINHLLLAKSFLLVGLVYPLLYCIAKLDLVVANKEGLGVVVIAQR